MFWVILVGLISFAALVTLIGLVVSAINFTTMGGTG